MFKKFILFYAFFLFMYGCASLTPKTETSIGKAVFDVDINIPSKELVNKLNETFAVRVNNLQKTVGILPTSLPNEPGTPDISVKNMGAGLISFTMPNVTCNSAYAIISGLDKGVKTNLGTSDSANYTACIYPYKDAYRVYIIGTFVSSSGGGLGGLVASGIKQGIAGTETIQTVWFKNLIKDFQNNFPQAKEIQIDIP